MRPCARSARAPGGSSVAITTWASFASMWLIPRMEAFQRQHPDIDIRIDASDTAVDLATADVDLALRYAVPSAVPRRCDPPVWRAAHPGDQPLAAARTSPCGNIEDLAQRTLIEAGDAHRTRHLEWLTWQRWLDTYRAHHPTPPAHGKAHTAKPKFSPKRWLYFNYAHQIVQAALTGQGVALARMPLVAQSLANGDLVEAAAPHPLDSPLAYWLMRTPRQPERPEVKAFCDWLLQEAAATREAIGEVPDPDTVDHMD